MAHLQTALAVPAQCRPSAKCTSQRPSLMFLRGQSAMSASKGQQRAGARLYRSHPTNRLRYTTRAVSQKNSEVKTEAKDDLSTADEVTNKYGLEAGLWSVMRSKDSNEAKGTTAKELLTRYGSAYLITSITLAIISFAFFYVLVDNGVDVSALLSKVGLDLGDKGGKVGTVAIAYAAHKAASPIRFPPTVALTPLVAKAIGKNKEVTEDEGKDTTGK